MATLKLNSWTKQTNFVPTITASDRKSFTRADTWKCSVTSSFSVASSFSLHNVSKKRVKPIRAATEESAEETTENAPEATQENEPKVEKNGGIKDTSVKALITRLREAIAKEDAVTIDEVQLHLEAAEKDRVYLGEQVSSLSEEISLGKERLLRLNADFDNFRKRSDREKSQLANSVRGDVVELLLPMIDNFERAKTSIKTETEAEKKIENSYQSIYKQFVEALKALGVGAVETVGKSFDPSVHDAIMREESSEFEEGIVLEEFRKGFTIGGKLVRPAMVKVSSGPGPNSTTKAEVSEDESAAPEQEATVEEQESPETKEGN